MKTANHKPAKKRQQAPGDYIGFRADVFLSRKIREHAAADGRSIGSWIRKILADAMIARENEQ